MIDFTRIKKNVQLSKKSDTLNFMIHYYETFYKIAEPILQNEKYQTLKQFNQHGKVSTYTHCVHVAYKAYVFNIEHHLGLKDKDVIYAGLLHDYYLYDWHNKVQKWHGFVHPKIASNNAERDFEISEICKEAIETHMWPLTITKIPNSKLGWLITYIDKQCSLYETLFKR